jgi:ferrous iron transport protein A
MSANAFESISPAKAVDLAQLKKGDRAIVVGLTGSDDADHSAIKRRLLELGFAAGEPVRIVAESFPGRDPIAVRLGNTTFALRRNEAAMIRVTQAVSRNQPQGK